jgi:hypothetical protein
LQSLNRYSYCSNNPLVYTDPTGHGDVDQGWSTDGTRGEGMIDAYTDAPHNQTFGEEFQETCAVVKDHFVNPGKYFFVSPPAPPTETDLLGMLQEPGVRSVTYNGRTFAFTQGPSSLFYSYNGSGGLLNGVMVAGDYWARVYGNFVETNKTIPGLVAPSMPYLPGVGMGLFAIGKTAQALGSAGGPFSWALGGFRGAAMSGATFTSAETGIIALGTSAVNFCLVGTSWESGLFVGSMISAITVDKEGCTVSESIANTIWNWLHR